MRDGLFIGAAAAAWALVGLVILAEFAEPLKAVLAAAFGHHWIGKATIVLGVFVLLTLALQKREIRGAEQGAWYSVLGSLLAIALLYVAEFVW